MASLITFFAFVLDWILGDPQNWPHPVRFIGRLIGGGEETARDWAGGRPRHLRQAGIFLALFVIFATMAAAYTILVMAAHFSAFLFSLAALYLVYSSLCLKDLYGQTWAVEEALRQDNIMLARERLSFIVGRDTQNLEKEDIRRAAIETLAENLSDGLIAPMFYLALGGPVLAWGCKAVNTLDSMIGYKNEKYIDLGRFAAKLDDAVNYIPARLAALLLVAAAFVLGCDFRRAFSVWQSDGQLSSSPNSGHPEAAMAGALGIYLGGPASYGGVLFSKPFINEGGAEAEPETLKKAESLMLVASVLMLALSVITMLLFTGAWLI
jgi:adenosylcobinamide-phosphate synthase